MKVIGQLIMSWVSKNFPEEASLEKSGSSGRSPAQLGATRYPVRRPQGQTRQGGGRGGWRKSEWQQNKYGGASLVAQCLRIRLQCRGHGFKPWSGKIPHAAKQLSPCATTTESLL